MIDAKIEKQVVTGMIVSTEYLQGISQIYKDQLQIPMTRRIAGWCMDHYQRYDQAPTKHIEDIYKHQKKKIKEDERFLIEEFLDRLSQKYISSKKFNVPYVLDITEEYFRVNGVEDLKDKLETALEKGKITNAENLIKRFERTARPSSKGVDPFSQDAIIEAFNEETSDLMFGSPGKLGEVLGVFEREYLIAFFGTRGKGKTWWLLWTALLAVYKGYNVVFVSLEMSQKQLIRRIHQYTTGLPLRKGIVQIPKFTDEGKDITRFKEEYREQLTTKMAMERMADIDESSLIKANLKMLFYPSGSRTMGDLKSQLQNMEHYEGFIPDVIVTDIADNFKSEAKTDQKRHQLADVWGQHKALAQEKRCLVVTGSHANTARTGKDVGEGSATESMAKEDVCDVIIALNQKPEEKRQGVMRVGAIKHRHDFYDILREIYVTQCYQIGRAYLDSKIKDKKDK